MPADGGTARSQPTRIRENSRVPTAPNSVGPMGAQKAIAFRLKHAPLWMGATVGQKREKGSPDVQPGPAAAFLRESSSHRAVIH